MTRRFLCAAALLLSAGCASAGNQPPASGDGDARRIPPPPTISNTVWQMTPFALVAGGATGGVVTVGELRLHGDMGVGAADTLDGEIAVVGGTFYRFGKSGNVQIMTDPGDRLPFAVMTQWTPREAGTIRLVDGQRYVAPLLPEADSGLPTTDAFYALVVTGTWQEVHARTYTTVPPGRPVTPADQDTFTIRNVRGIMVGFREPPYVGPISVANYHFHFITTDRTPQRGGHVLSFTAGSDVKIEYSPRPYFSVYTTPGPRPTAAAPPPSP
ncbi:MAG TPA: acetolactate decarboxylase [Longimicrobium sp.]